MNVNFNDRITELVKLGAPLIPYTAGHIVLHKTLMLNGRRCGFEVECGATTLSIGVTPRVNELSLNNVYSEEHKLSLTPNTIIRAWVTQGTRTESEIWIYCGVVPGNLLPPGGPPSSWVTESK